MSSRYMCKHNKHFKRMLRLNSVLRYSHVTTTKSRLISLMALVSRNQEYNKGKREIVVGELKDGNITTDEARAVMSLLNMREPRKKRGICCRCGEKTKDYCIKGYYVCKSCMLNAILDTDDFISFSKCVICEGNVDMKNGERGKDFIVYRGKLICKDCYVRLRMITI
jgi:hypothetical protein